MCVLGSSTWGKFRSLGHELEGSPQGFCRWGALVCFACLKPFPLVAVVGEATALLRFGCFKDLMFVWGYILGLGEDAVVKCRPGWALVCCEVLCHRLWKAFRHCRSHSTWARASRRYVSSLSGLGRFHCEASCLKRKRCYACDMKSFSCGCILQSHNVRANLLQESSGIARVVSLGSYPTYIHTHVASQARCSEC